MEEDSPVDAAKDIRFLADPYRDWVAAEGLPLVSDFAVDLRRTEVAPWDRYDARGAVVNVKGRGDFLDLWLLEVPAGGATSPQHHVFEAVVYVIEGHGSASIVTSRGEQTFEWGPRSMFAIPLNATYRFFNASGTNRARLAMTTSFPILMNLFHDDGFIFGSTYEFEARLRTLDELGVGGAPGTFKPDERVRHFWVTNFVPDLGAFAELKSLAFRGRNSKSVMFLLADGVMHAHMSEIPTGDYKKAHRHVGGTHIYPVDGYGYSLLWYEGDSERKRVDWEHGVVYSPPDDMYHQHFNLADRPSRYFAVKMGNFRYPFSERMTRQFKANASEVASRRDQIEYDDEDLEIRALYSSELERANKERAASEAEGA